MHRTPPRATATDVIELAGGDAGRVERDQECADPSRAAARRAGPRPHDGETGLCGETRRGLLAVQNVGVTVGRARSRRFAASDPPPGSVRAIAGIIRPPTTPLR